MSETIVTIVGLEGHGRLDDEKRIIGPFEIILQIVKLQLPILVKLEQLPIAGSNGAGGCRMMVVGVMPKDRLPVELARLG